jgi:hypothetical protein
MEEGNAPLAESDACWVTSQRLGDRRAGGAGGTILRGGGLGETTSRWISRPIPMPPMARRIGADAMTFAVRRAAGRASRGIKAYDTSGDRRFVSPAP